MDFFATFSSYFFSSSTKPEDPADSIPREEETGGDHSFGGNCVIA
jgi:hypothetical protein